MQLRTTGDRIRGLRRRHTFLRLINYLIVELQRLFGFSRVCGYPHFLVIETTNLCNLKCPLCPTGQGLPGREKGRMGLDNFKRIINQLKRHAYSLRLENWGEPLLNEALPDMIRYAADSGISVSFNTNLLYLEQQLAEKLVDSGLDYIKISLDGASQETYGKYRIGGDFIKVVNNIKVLIETREKLHSKKPLVEIQFIVMKHNVQDIEAVKRLAQELRADSLLLIPPRPDMRQELLEPQDKNIAEHKEWLPDDFRLSMQKKDFIVKRRKWKRCRYLWNSMVINWDGSVVPCCSIYDPEYDFGNILTGSFHVIWNNEKYCAARRMISSGRLSEPKTICVNCYKYGVI